MAIRETWHRIIRKSVSSTSSSERSDDDGRYHPAVAFPPIPSAPSSRKNSRLGKITSWRPHAPPNYHNTNGPAPARGARVPPIRDPSKRKLTAENLRHQEMLGMFTMKFGRSRRPGRAARSDLTDISPGCSRVGSLDLRRGGSAASTREREREREREGEPPSPGFRADRRMSSVWRPGEF